MIFDFRIKEKPLLFRMIFLPGSGILFLDISNNPFNLENKVYQKPDPRNDEEDAAKDRAPFGKGHAHLVTA